MGIFMSLLVSIIIYISSFKDELKKEDFDKLGPLLVLIGILTLLGGL